MSETHPSIPSAMAQWRHAALFVALFLGWGVLSPFLPAVLAAQGASTAEVGLLLGLGIVVRLVAMPVAGVLADQLDASRLVLAAALLGAALAALGYGLATGFAALLLVGILHAMATGPMGPLPDALAVRAAAADPARFDYGVVRGVGAAAFIGGTLLAGALVEHAQSPLAVLWANAPCFALAALLALALPRLARAAEGPRPAGGAPLRRLAGIAGFRRLLLVSALVQGSHALYLGFATLHWQAAGIAPTTIGLLWAVSVAAEVVMFLWLGRRLLARLGPGRLSAVAAAAGVLRWSVMAVEDSAWAMLLVQPLHGLTYAAQHLAAMALLTRLTPGHLAATAQSLHATLGTGLAGAVLMFASGPLYERLGAGGFWVMAVLAGAGMFAAWTLPGSRGGTAAPR